MTTDFTNSPVLKTFFYSPSTSGSVNYSLNSSSSSETTTKKKIRGTDVVDDLLFSLLSSLFYLLSQGFCNQKKYRPIFTT